MVLYTGVTNDLLRRVGEHRVATFQGFTRRYNVHKLVYFEEFAEVTDAITRDISALMRSSEYPIAVSPSRVCSPSAGAGRRSLPGVPDRRGITLCISTEPASASGASTIT